MAAYTIRLINTHAALRQCPDHNRNQACTLMQDFWKSSSTDACRRVETAAEKIETCLDKLQYQPPDLKGEYFMLKLWYHHASAR